MDVISRFFLFYVTLVGFLKNLLSLFKKGKWSYILSSLQYLLVWNGSFGCLWQIDLGLLIRTWKKVERIDIFNQGDLILIFLFFYFFTNLQECTEQKNIYKPVNWNFLVNMNATLNNDFWLFLFCLVCFH